jgi:hypothetical protein
MLMTKFGKAEKTGCFSFLLQIVRFWQFQTQTKQGARIEDLKIQGEFKHGKGRQALKDQDKRMKSQKPDGPILNFGGSGFLRTDRVQLGFKI